MAAVNASIAAAAKSRAFFNCVSHFLQDFGLLAILSHKPEMSVLTMEIAGETAASSPDHPGAVALGRWSMGGLEHG